MASTSVTKAVEAEKRTPTFSCLSTSQATVIVLIRTLSKPPTSNVFAPKPSSDAAAEEHKFVIHKEFICYYSPFFSASFNGHFEEGRTQRMTMVDVDPALFAILVNWVYCKVVTNEKGKRPDLVSCAKLWLLADRFLMNKLQNDAMKQIHAGLSAAYSSSNPAFGEFCHIAKMFDEWVEQVPVPILISVSKAMKACRGKLSSYQIPEEASWSSDEKNYFVKDPMDVAKK